MNKFVINSSVEDLIIKPNTKVHRGAKVYGLPVSKELGSYLDEVDARSSCQRIVDMFFAGCLNSVDSFDFEDDDF